ncbi:uncharacterized protein [Penaeus vannamei]|uniref:uncharacterized protein n=1 Tax=Penaeus vannamei TaxID=6689 RepID=UPI00387F4732
MVLRRCTDRILALQVIVERRCEFGRGLLTIYIDLKKAFDSVHRESLWEILRLIGIPTRIIESIASRYTVTRSAIISRATVQSQCRATLGNIKVTDLDFADDVAILYESLESLVAVLDTFSNEAKPLGLQVS